MTTVFQGVETKSDTDDTVTMVKVIVARFELEKTLLNKKYDRSVQMEGSKRSTRPCRPLPWTLEALWGRSGQGIRATMSLTMGGLPKTRFGFQTNMILEGLPIFWTNLYNK